MPIDTNRIDEQIRKLQELKRLLADPDMRGVVDTLIVEDGAANRKSANRMVSKPNRSTGKDALIRAVHHVIESGQPKFTSRDVIEALENSAFQFSAKDPVVAVNGALRRLLAKGAIAVVTPGVGRRHGVYERTGGAPEGRTPTKPAMEGRSEQSRPMRVLALFQQRPGDVLSVEAVASELGMKVSEARAPVLRLTNDGKLMRIGRGQYVLMGPGNIASIDLGKERAE